MGLILWGVGAAHSVHWFGLIAAMFILSASITIAIPVSCNYAIDTYQQLGGQAMGMFSPRSSPLSPSSSRD